MIFHVINLDRSPERWRFMEAMGAERGIATRRVAAVDGKLLSPEELERVSPSVNGARFLSATEIACFESHKRAWRLIAEGDAPFGCVLEDDVYLARSIGRICDALVREHPEFDLVKLNNYLKPVYFAQAPAGGTGPLTLLRPLRRTIDASAYLMSRACAREALAAYERYEEEVDILLFDPATGRRIAQVMPAVAVQAKHADFAFLDAQASESTIELTRAESRAEVKARRGRQSLWVKAGKELRRFWQRRVLPRALGAVNLFRRPQDRVALRLVTFSDR